MPALIATMLVMVLAAMPEASAQPAAAAADSAAVVRAVAAYDAAWARKDTAAARKLMSPRYQYFTSIGGVRTREEMVAFLARPDYRLDRVERSEVAVTIEAAVAVVSSRWVGQGSWAGGEIADDQRCGLVFVRHGSEWRLLAEHCVQIAQP